MNHLNLCSLSFFLFISFASSSSNTTHRRCSAMQTHALLLFKQNVFSTNNSFDAFSYSSYPNHVGFICYEWLGSNNYPIMTNWNMNIDCCNWDGVTCDHSTGDVIALDLSCGMLQGTIHPNSTLFNLPRLQILNLAFNNLTGSQLPREIGRFSNSLTHLNISYSGFRGQVPMDITILRKLVSLDLSFNYDLRFEPHVFYGLLHNSTSLVDLSLNYVNISSILPTYLNISSFMKSLHLSGTGLLGKLPYNIFNLPYLEELDLAYVDIIDKFPKINESINIPLKWLDLSNTGLLGEIPKSIGYLKSLITLDFSHTNLSGEIPESISHLKSLITFDLSQTNLSGEIPESIRHLKSLIKFDLSQTNLLGEIPSSIGHLKSLNYLFLSNTGLLGEIPESVGHLKSLITLDLSNTNLSGEIPESIGHLKSLITLDLSYTNLSGEIPESIGHLKSLNFLALSNTGLSGEIPNSIGHLKSLIILHISFTNISGEIPDSIGHLKSLITFDLHSNLIEGSFPPSICNMRDLHLLDMSNNRFGGVIPECLGNISSVLMMVDLGNNSFHGTIPNAWNDCGRLQGLILNGNSLEGDVPSGLSNCESLKVLDLGNNHLNGTFPHSLGHLPHLQVLVLKSNKLHGPIESSSIIKHPFSSLKVLDLSQNKFVGLLPQEYFQTFDAMKNKVKKGMKLEYLRIGKFYSITIAVKGLELPFPKISVDYTIIDMSGNVFEGEIPNVIGSLNSLIVLNLSHNNLNGRIPNALGNLLEIESLDLSRNRLTGEIPQSLAGITNLAFLNLSQNHLVGRIPHGSQFDTFDWNSFGGNPGLYRSPLPTQREHPSSPQLEDATDGDEESGFTWKVVMLGYGCGIILGMAMGYLMLSTGRPKWFNAISDDIEHMIHRRQNKRRSIYNGKRNQFLNGRD